MHPERRGTNESGKFWRSDTETEYTPLQTRKAARKPNLFLSFDIFNTHTSIAAIVEISLIANKIRKDIKDTKCLRFSALFCSFEYLLFYKTLWNHPNRFLNRAKSNFFIAIANQKPLAFFLNEVFGGKKYGTFTVWSLINHWFYPNRNEGWWLRWMILSGKKYKFVWIYRIEMNDTEIKWNIHLHCMLQMFGTESTRNQ